jgi:hypothetical protein
MGSLKFWKCEIEGKQCIMNTGKLKGLEKMLQMAGKHKLQELKSGVYCIIMILH